MVLTVVVLYVEAFCFERRHLHILADTTCYESTFYEFIPCDLLTMLLFFKLIHSIKFRVT